MELNGFENSFGSQMDLSSNLVLPLERFVSLGESFNSPSLSFLIHQVGY